MSRVASRAGSRAEDARAIARELFALDARDARELPGERDRNFHLVTDEGDFVLKISGAAERREALELQSAALAWIASRAPSLPVPRIRPAADGREIAEIPFDEGAPRLVRLFEWLPGRVLAEARPHAAGMLRRLGTLLGDLDRGLDGFAHAAAVRRDLPWNPDLAPDVLERLAGAVVDSRRRAIVEKIAALRASSAAALARLPRSVIHDDANDWNVLVSEPAADPNDRSVTGLLDFGDMLETWTVSEPAVAAAYAMLGSADPLAAAGAVVAGYLAARPLSEDELAAVFPLALTRLAVSVCLSAHRRIAEPDNAYLTVSEAPAWEALERLGGTPPGLAEAVLRDACGLAPCRNGPAVAAWLRAHAAEAAPVVPGDLARAPVFDLSVGSAELESVAAAADTAALTRKIFEALRTAGADVAIGRYDEARLVYQSDAFRGGDGENPEARTVHVAVDLFAAPGTPVFAPFAGRVHGFGDNAARLDYGPTVILEHAPEGGPVFYTLYGHLTGDSLDGLAAGKRIAKGAVVGRIGAPPENGDWPPHVHFQVIADVLGGVGDFPGVAAPGRRDVWRSLCPDPSLVLGRDVACRAPESGALAARRRSLLGPSLSLSYREPLEIVRGSGAFLYDANGRAYLDGVNNVAHVGHAHPRVVAAGTRAMAVLNTNTRYLHPAIVDYADRLAATLPPPLSVCFFVCSGSEANELALRIARAHTRGRDVVVVDGAYHGNTAGLIDVSPYKFDGPGGAGAPEHVRKVPMPDDYRGPHRRDDPNRGEAFASHVEQAFRGIREVGRRPAAFLCESLLSCGGQIVLPPGFLAAAHRHARAAGAVCIADEVQVGFGRVGTCFWGFETQGVVPDIVTMGKPIGNGHPLAAVVTTPELAASFANGMEYFNTFGGNPVSCAIGLAVLDVIRDEKLQEHALAVGGRLLDGLRGLVPRHPIVGDARGLGLFLGIELVRDRETLEPAPAEAAYVVERMKAKGVLLSTDGPLHNVIKIKPPLVFSEADADRIVAGLDAVLAEDFVRARVR